jgi:hypothetical protein
MRVCEIFNVFVCMRVYGGGGQVNSYASTLRCCKQYIFAGVFLCLCLCVCVCVGVYACVSFFMCPPRLDCICVYEGWAAGG